MLIFVDMPLEAELPMKTYEVAQIIEHFQKVEISYNIKEGGVSGEILNGEDAAQYFIEIFQGGNEYELPSRVNSGNVSKVDFIFRGDQEETEFKIETPEMRLKGGKEIDFKVFGSQEIPIQKILKDIMEFDALKRI